MKYKLTNQEVALVAVLLAAIIVSHAFAPAAASAVVSVASTLVGVFFVNRRDKGEEKKPAPVLELVKGEKDGGK